jgi:predicted Rossmann-fold nucleotide-binding protein
MKEDGVPIDRDFATIAVYCGSSNRVDARYFDVAHGVGVALASRGIDIVYGGGSVGLMGRLADAALEAGGKVDRKSVV